jgi:PhnB protein
MFVSAHLDFTGTCEEAMNFYASTFEGNVQFKMTWGESPMSDQVGPDYTEKVMHMSVKVGVTTLMGCDVPRGTPAHEAQRIRMSIAMPEFEIGQKVFAALSEGGTVEMPFASTFWAKGFGMCTDRFGIPWMVNCGEPTA